LEGSGGGLILRYCPGVLEGLRKTIKKHARIADLLAII
jgi:hypothetical protein